MTLLLIALALWAFAPTTAWLALVAACQRVQPAAVWRIA